MIDPRPLAHYIAVEFDWDYQDVLDALCDFFFLNADSNGFFVGDAFKDYVFPKFSFPEDLNDGASGSVDDYTI